MAAKEGDAKLIALYLIDSILRKNLQKYPKEKEKEKALTFAKRFEKNIMLTFSSIVECPKQELVSAYSNTLAFQK